MPFDPKWEAIHRHVEWSINPDPFLLAFLEKYRFPVGTTFLDLGCGTGASALYLAQKHFKVIAVDGSQAAIKKLSYSPNFNGMIIPILEDINTLRLPDLSIDAVIDICCLQHLLFSEAETLLERARIHWLRQGGKILSRMATTPYNLSLSRTSKIRMTPEPKLKKMFSGYKVTWEKYTFWPHNKQATHWVIQGGI